MTQPGRRSAAAASVVQPATNGPRPRLIPPSSLTKAERAIFTSIAATARHLTETDTVLLAAYATAVAKTARLGKGKDTADWERSARVMAMLATKLRLTPQATASPQTIARQRKNALPPSYYDVMPDGDDDE